jgi:general nucleoside transport system ATP-binding protein
VGDLSAGERQRVEIIRCLLQDPQLLIMDEPTSVLTPQEVDILFRTLRKLRPRARSILYISHKLEEIRALCEPPRSCAAGRSWPPADPRESTARELAELMVGTTLTGCERPRRTRANRCWRCATCPAAGLGLFGTPLRDVSLTVHARRDCWASAAWPATGRTNCWPRCRANPAQPRRRSS